MHRVLLRHRHRSWRYHRAAALGALIERASGSGGVGITGIAVGYYLGGALMVVGGLAEVFLGVKPEGQSFKSIAKPLTADDETAARD